VGLDTLAVTDHDTVAGIPEALARGQFLGVEVIPGVELSAEAGDGRTFHLLGYGMDTENEAFLAALARLQEGRNDRNERMLIRLSDLGKPLDPGLLEQHRFQGVVGRPHMARIMLEMGYVTSVEEAFREFLAKGAQGYEERFRPTAKEAISMVREAGGIPVLAHPHTLGLQTELELEAFVARQVEENGLMGLEVLYPDRPPQQETSCRFLSEKYHLLMTGGTDFHGTARAHISLGWGRGDLRVPRNWADRLREAALGLRKPGSG